MFIFKENTEIINLEEEIKVVGLSLQKSELPISFDSLGKMWEIYGNEYRGKDRIKNAVFPVTEYAIALNRVPDYITGCGVSEIENMDEACSSFIIPKGKYIRDTFNAESFEKLVDEVLVNRNVKAWAKENKVKIDRLFTVEVYPWGEFDKNNFEMYTLTPLKE